MFQCQFIGSKSNVFVGNLAVGAPGTIPLNKGAPLSPLGSCPAHPQGPIADGTQLSDIVTEPFASGTSTPATDVTTTSSNAPNPGSDGAYAALAQSIQILTFPSRQITSGPLASHKPNYSGSYAACSFPWWWFQAPKWAGRPEIEFEI